MHVPKIPSSIPAASSVTRGIVLAAVVLAACGHGNVPLPPLTGTPRNDSTLIARGEYIVRTVATCGGCHAADQKNPDGSLIGGAEFKDWRLGTARAPDITSDSLRGIGAWTDAQIVRAIRNGQ